MNHEIVNIAEFLNQIALILGKNGDHDGIEKQHSVSCAVDDGLDEVRHRFYC